LKAVEKTLGNDYKIEVILDYDRIVSQKTPVFYTYLLNDLGVIKLPL